MKVYLGQTRSRALMRRLDREGIGEMCVAEEYPPRRKPWVYDNGVFKAWCAKQEWDSTAFEAGVGRLSFSSRIGCPERGPTVLSPADRPLLARRSREQQEHDEQLVRAHPRKDEMPPPGFVVVPDAVADAPKTLALAGHWIDRLRAMMCPRPVRLAFVLQNGMTYADVKPLLPRVETLFVGGTTEWKWRTAPVWAEVAHDAGLTLHIGRAGTPDLLRRAYDAGADSIDSTSPLWTKEKLDAFLAALKALPVREAA